MLIDEEYMRINAVRNMIMKYLEITKVGSPYTYYKILNDFWVIILTRTRRSSTLLKGTAHTPTKIKYKACAIRYTNLAEESLICLHQRFPQENGPEWLNLLQIALFFILILNMENLPKCLKLIQRI